MTMLVDNSGMKEIYRGSFSAIPNSILIKISLITFFKLIPMFYRLKRLHYPYISSAVEWSELKESFKDLGSLEILDILNILEFYNYKNNIHFLIIEVDYNLPNITNCYT